MGFLIVMSSVSDVIIGKSPFDLIKNDIQFTNDFVLAKQTI